MKNPKKYTKLRLNTRQSKHSVQPKSRINEKIQQNEMKINENEENPKL